jgi:hypothetical protein
LGYEVVFLEEIGYWLTSEVDLGSPVILSLGFWKKDLGNSAYSDMYLTILNKIFSATGSIPK